MHLQLSIVQLHEHTQQKVKKYKTVILIGNFYTLLGYIHVSKTCADLESPPPHRKFQISQIYIAKVPKICHDTPTPATNISLVPPG